jgi:hypothetical protein
MIGEMSWVLRCRIDFTLLDMYISWKDFGPVHTNFWPSSVQLRALPD